jgi:hypothetical protein
MKAIFHHLYWKNKKILTLEGLIPSALKDIHIHREREKMFICVCLNTRKTRNIK